MACAPEPPSRKVAPVEVSPIMSVGRSDVAFGSDGVEANWELPKLFDTRPMTEKNALILLKKKLEPLPDVKIATNLGSIFELVSKSRLS